MLGGVGRVSFSKILMMSSSRDDTVRPVGLEQAVHRTEVTVISQEHEQVNELSSMALTVQSNEFSTTQSGDVNDKNLTKEGELQRFDLDLDSIDSEDLMQGELYLSQQVGNLDQIKTELKTELKMFLICFFNLVF